MILMCVASRHMRFAELAYFPLAFGWVWNFESGVVGLAMFAVFVIAARFRPSWRAMLSLAMKQAAFLTASIFLAYLVVREYYRMRFGAAPSIGEQLRIIFAYSVGVGSEPMPFLGAWAFHFLIYGISIFVGIRALFETAEMSAGQKKEQRCFRLPSWESCG